MATPQPPTRLTVSGGPKADPILSTIDTPKRDPYRMAHPTTKTRLIKASEAWAVGILVVLAIVIYLVFDGSVS